MAIMPLRDGFDNAYALYYLENVFEALSEPGEWYVDTTQARIYYMPKEG